jgi:hypothetical protein
MRRSDDVRGGVAEGEVDRGEVVGVGDAPGAVEE